MNNDEIIHMARQAEQYADTFCESIGDTDQNHWFDAYNERFAALVAAHEREACAKVCAEGWKEGIGAKHQGDVFAVVIRARGEV